MHLKNRGISNINTVTVEKQGHQRVKGLHLMKKKLQKRILSLMNMSAAKLQIYKQLQYKLFVSRG